MKQGGFLMVCLVLAVTLFSMPLFGQAGSINFESKVIDNFDTPETMEWTWYAQGSRFITEGFPKLKFVEGMPNSLSLVQNDPEKKYQILGVQSNFERKGDNWIEIIPVKKAEDGNVTPFEIPLPGQVSQIDIWVWGAKYLYFMEMLVRDADGRVHTLDFGPISHEGWKNISVKMPTYIRQRSRLLTGPQNISLVAMRIRTDPRERVDTFTVYFDQIKILTDTFINAYDGFDISTVNFD